jgi:uncharacterized membrane protein YcgQ (UPF0703/DUF1980 family)
MGIKSLKGGHVAKQKNPRKKMQEQIDEIGGATSAVIKELRNVNNHLMGLESLTISLAEFLGKKEKFEEFVREKIRKIEQEDGDKKKATIIKKKKSNDVING